MTTIIGVLCVLASIIIDLSVIRFKERSNIYNQRSIGKWRAVGDLIYKSTMGFERGDPLGMTNRLGNTLFTFAHP